MTREEFEDIVRQEFPHAIPEKFRKKIQNVDFIVEGEPSYSIRKEQHLRAGETLLGLYRGIPLSHRGQEYGIGAVMPDVIMLFQLPIESAALTERRDVREVVRETIWHEVAHHFGFGETEVREKEARHRKRA